MANNPIYVAFGDAVATRRTQLGLTQAKLAARVGMSRASVANIESGRQNVLLHHVYAFAEALDLGRVAELLPPVSPKSAQEELKMSLSNNALSKQTLSDRGTAQISDLIASALAPKRSTKAGS